MKGSVGREGCTAARYASAMPCSKLCSQKNIYCGAEAPSLGMSPLAQLYNHSIDQPTNQRFFTWCVQGALDPQPWI